MAGTLKARGATLEPGRPTTRSIGVMGDVALVLSLGFLVFALIAAASTLRGFPWLARGLLVVAACAIFLASVMVTDPELVVSQVATSLVGLTACMWLVLQAQGPPRCTTSPGDPVATPASSAALRMASPGPSSSSGHTAPGLQHAQLASNEAEAKAARVAKAELTSGLWSGLPLSFFSDLVAALAPRDLTAARLVCTEWRRMCSTTLTHLTPAALDPPRLLAAFPSIVDLDLSKCSHGVRASSVRAVVRALPQLRSLCLGSSSDGAPPGLSNRWLAQLATGIAPHLQTLALAQASHITDQGLIALSCMSSLTAIDLSGCVAVTDVGVMLLTQLPRLTALNLSWCLKLSNSSIKALNSRVATLTSLDISGCPLLTEVGLQGLGSLTLLESLTATHLGLAQPAITDATLAAWSSLARLTHLGIGGMQAGLTEVSDDALRALPVHHPRLVALSLLALDGITDAGLLEAVDQLGLHLTYLHVRNCNQLTRGTLAGLGGCLPHLVDLDMLNNDQLVIDAAAVAGLLGLSTVTPPSRRANSLGPGARGPTTAGVAARTPLVLAGARPPSPLRSLILGNWSPPSVRHIQCFDDACLAALRPLGPTLHTLMLSSFGGAVASQDASATLSTLSNLAALELHSCPALVDEGFAALAAAPFAARLTRLSLGNTGARVSPQCVTALLAACPALEHLGMRSVGMAVTDTVLEAVAEVLPALRALHVSHTPCTVRKGLVTLLRRLPRLNCFELSFCGRLDGLGRALGAREMAEAPADRSGSPRAATSPAPASTPRLRTVTLTCSDLDEESIQVLAAHAPHATTFDASQCIGITDSAAAALPGMPHLTSVDLSQCSRITDEAVRQLARLTALATLRLAGCVRVTDDGIAALVASGAAKLGRLQTLHLDKCLLLTDAGLRQLAGVTSLTSLRTSRCPELTDDGVRHLARLTRLSTLSVAHCPHVTDAGLSEILTLTALASLEF